MDKSNLIIVKCPECGGRLSFKPIPNYREKSITCPKCGYANRADKYIMLQDPAAPHVGSPSPRPSTATAKPRTVRVKIVCKNSGEEHRLTDGLNTIGRSCTNPRATILFRDEEHHMSRLHASLKVSTESEGYIHLQIKDEDSMNGTFVKGKRLPQNSLAKVNPGDEITMGKMRFVCVVEG